MFSASKVFDCKKNKRKNRSQQENLIFCSRFSGVHIILWEYFSWKCYLNKHFLKCAIRGRAQNYLILQICFHFRIICLISKQAFSEAWFKLCHPLFHIRKRWNTLHEKWYLAWSFSLVGLRPIIWKPMELTYQTHACLAAIKNKNIVNPNYAAFFETIFSPSK